jgi:hypothetical protein
MPTTYVCWNITDGHERWSVQDGVRLIPLAGGRRLVVHRRDAAASTNALVILDAADGREVGRSTLGKGSAALAGLDGRTILVEVRQPFGLDAVWMWLAEHGIPAPKPSSDSHLELLDTATGRLLLTLPDGNAAFAPDGQSFAFISDGRPGTVELWDIPPRKPLTWFALAAAVLALPLAGLAWRRSHRLRREVA